jgi:hypothetical protein
VRLQVLALAIVGIGTFFLPLVTTNTPVLGETRWSLFDIVFRICSGELPPGRRTVDPVGALLGLAITLLPIYLILLYSGAAALLSFSSLRPRLYLVGLVGTVISVGDWHWDKRVFEELFFGGWSPQNSGAERHVGFGQLVLTIIIVMASLVYIARDNEVNQALEKARPRGRTSAGPEPEFLDAEILPPEQAPGRRGPEHRRLR